MDRFKFPNIRSMFVPDPGYEFFDIDLDSADLRIVVWESDCTEMKAMFAAGRKPYVEVAKEYYRDPTITKHHSSYPAFKSLCHGTNYLGKAAGVAPRVGLLVHEVDRIQKWYFGKFPQIKAWQDDIIKRITTDRYIRNVWGYRLNFFDRISEQSFREGVAWIPQSSVGILINHAYVNIDRNLPDVQVLLQVHDSLAGQYPYADAVRHREAVVREAAVALPYPDPLVIPVGIKTSTRSWGDCG